MHHRCLNNIFMVFTERMLSQLATQITEIMITLATVKGNSSKEYSEQQVTVMVVICCPL